MRMRTRAVIAVVALAVVGLTGCSPESGLEACPVAKDKVIAIIGKVVTEPDVSVEADDAYGGAMVSTCYMTADDTDGYTVYFDSVSSEDAEDYRDLWFDAGSGELTQRVDWGDGGYFLKSDQLDNYYAAFERAGRLWSMVAMGPLPSSSDERDPGLDAAMLELAEAAFEGAASIGLKPE